MTKECISFEDLVRYHNQECKTYEFLTKHPPCPIPIAKHFYDEEMSVNDKESGIIILEDLSDKAVSLKLFEDANIQKIINLSEHIAKLQAYGMKHADEVDDYFEPQADGFYNQVLNILEDKIIEQRSEVGDERMKLSNKQILDIAKNAKAKMEIFHDPTPYGFTRVLNLGDVQPNNILWLKNSAGEPSDEIGAFIDFQLSHMGNCMNDIQLTLNYCLSTGDRRKHQDAIMDHYLTTLSSELSRDGSNQSNQSIDQSNQSINQSPISKEEAKEVATILAAQFGCVWMGFMPALTHFIEAAKVDPSSYDRFFERVLDLLIEAYPIFVTEKE